MMNKIDFSVVINVESCNPNGDPLSLNRPRVDLDGYGEISDVCLKRKIRDRLQDMGCNLFVQSDSRRTDSFRSMKERLESCEPILKELKKKDKADVDTIKELACENWIDIRTFGQVLPYKGVPVAIGVRGPVSIGQARSLEPVDVVNYLQTVSCNYAAESGRDRNTMYNRYVIKKGVYVANGSIFPSLAEKTGFSDSDSELIKEALRTLFENDASSTRPSGSMSSSLYWWTHDSRQAAIPSSKVFRSLHIAPSSEYPYYTIAPEELPGSVLEIYD